MPIINTVNGKYREKLPDEKEVVMPKIDKDGREYIEQDGKRFYRNFMGEWKAETNWLGNDKVETDWLGNPKIETDWLGRQKVETDWLGNPLVPTDKKNDEGGCYLTTACMAALRDDFRDDCDELVALRNFRDTYVREYHPDDIPCYYDVAPRIVAALNDRADRHRIYAKMYHDLVLGAIILINKGLFEQAYGLYKAYGKKLESQYLLLDRNS
jgi:hypothetical protein